MNYNGLQEKYAKPKRNKHKDAGKPFVYNYYRPDKCEDYYDWKKKAVKTKKKTKKVENLSYQEQLKDSRWVKKREEVFKAKGYVCCKCGCKNNLQVHHLKYKDGKMAWEYPLKDLIVLCEKCHSEVHQDLNNELNPYHKK